MSLKLNTIFSSKDMVLSHRELEDKLHTGRKYLQDTSDKTLLPDFPSGTADKNPSADAGDTGLIPGPGRFHMLPSN